MFPYSPYVIGARASARTLTRSALVSNFGVTTAPKLARHFIFIETSNFKDKTKEKLLCFYWGEGRAIAYIAVGGVAHTTR